MTINDSCFQILAGTLKREILWGFDVMTVDRYTYLLDSRLEGNTILVDQTGMLSIPLFGRP